MDATEKKPKYLMTNRQLARFLWRYIKPYRVRFFVSTFVRFLGELFFTINPYFYATVIAMVAKGAPLESTYIYFACWGATYFLRIGGQRLGRWIGNRLAERAAIDAELVGISQIIAWPLIEHENEDTGNKIERIVKGAEGIKQTLKLWQDSWVGIFTQVTTMLLVLFFINRLIALFIILFLVVYYLVSHPLLSRAYRIGRRVNKQKEEMSGFAFEIVNNIRTTKVMRLSPWLHKRLGTMADELYWRVKMRVVAFQGAGAIIASFAQLIRLAFVAYIINGVYHGTFTVAFLLMFVMYFTNFRDSSEQLSESMEDFAIARHNIARFADIEKHCVVEDLDRAKQMPPDWQTLTLKDLSFSYGDNAVLKNLNLTIRRGERIGVVGLSGAGKSTLFKLLLKEHQNYSGEILFDTTPLRDIDPASFAVNTAVVLQDTEVFNLSLKDNIVLGVPAEEDNADRLAKALSVSHVQEFVEKLPDGVETLIGEKGIKLSGGERQRVGIARAVFKEPQILFLDEATSHLDVESEEKIQDSLHQFFREVTAVVIAHRLTTIKEMDRIVVIDNGCIIEEGTFDELYQQQGRFFDLWEKQKL